MRCRTAPFCFAVAVSTTAAAASLDVFIAIDDIDGELQEAEDALLDVAATNPKPAALLVPAIQKVREATAQVMDECMTERGGDDACAAEVLSDAILASYDGRDPALSLVDLYMAGTGTKEKQAIFYIRKNGNETAAGTEVMLEGLLAGLLESAYDIGAPEAATTAITDGLLVVRY